MSGSTRRSTAFVGIGVSILLCAGAAVQPARATVVVTWNEAALEEVRRGKMGPPVVARALAVAHTCIYDAWVPYDARAIASTVAIPRRPAAERTEAHKAAAVSFAAYRCLVNLFPAGAARLEAVMRSLGHDPLNTSTDPGTPQGIGNAAAAAVIADRRDDGSNQYGDLHPGAYSDDTQYSPSNLPMPFCLPATPGACPLNVANVFRWQPLINDVGVTQVFVAPHWGRVRPFALSSGAQFDQVASVADGPNYLQSPAAFQADVDEMLFYSRNLTPQQKLIVEYWADGPQSEFPPGHWSLFAQHVSRRDSHGIDRDVKMFFAMQNASMDAGIVAWHQKRRFDGVRPITAVRFFRQGVPLQAWGGPGRPITTIDGGKWSPYNPGSNLSPAFAGYVSGHSTFSASSAAVLRAFTGSDTLAFSTELPPNYGRVEPGVPLVPTTMRYATYSAAVEEAGLSRLYAGIHFADDNTDGQLLGNLTAQQAWAKAFTLFTGGLPAATAGAGSNVTCRNATLGAMTVANVVVPQNARCVLLGTRVTGNLELAAGAGVDASEARIDGNVGGDGTGSVQLAGGRIGGSVQLRRGQELVLGGTSVNGSVQLEAMPGTIALRDLSVNGDVQLFGNRGGAVLSRITANGNLQCSGNKPAPTGGGNLASSKEGQCRPL
jgi:hypothetical protein